MSFLSTAISFISARGFIASTVLSEMRLFLSSSFADLLLRQFSRHLAREGAVSLRSYKIESSFLFRGLSELFIIDSRQTADLPKITPL